MHSPPKLCSFESRRTTEMATLITKFGGTPVSAPSMKEVPLDQHQPAMDAIREIVNGHVNALVLMTGVGTEAMFRIAESDQLKERLLQAMQKIPLLVRGPKPAAVLKKHNLKWTVKAPAPNTWQDLLRAIEGGDVRLQNQTIAVQEYGVPNPQFYEALSQRGAAVLPMPVYRWALPDDLEPLKSAIRLIVEKEIDAVLFTSAQQLRHLLTVSEQQNCQSELLLALSETFVSSIGPTCSEAIRNERLAVQFEASPPKMGPLVRGTIQTLSGLG